MRKLHMVAMACAMALSPMILATSATADEAVSMTFKYQTQQLYSSSGAASILARLEAQAKRVCTAPSTTLVYQRTDMECAHDLMAKTVAAIKEESGSGEMLSGLFSQAPDLAVAQLEQR